MHVTTYVIYCPCRKAYWGSNEHGYTEYLSQAGTYTGEQVARIHAEGRLDDDEVIELPARNHQPIGSNLMQSILESPQTYTAAARLRHVADWLERNEISADELTAVTVWGSGVTSDVQLHMDAAKRLWPGRVVEVGENGFGHFHDDGIRVVADCRKSPMGQYEVTL